MHQIINFTVCCFTVSSSSSTDVGNRIVGGVESKLGDFPGLVSFQTKDFRHFCAGTILNDRHVVTAAHCMFAYATGPLLPQQFQLMAGDISTANSSRGNYRTYYQPALIFVHPKFDDLTKQNDIAVVRTDTQIANIPLIIRPIEISKTVFVHGAECWVAGWGFLNETDKKPVKKQHKVNLPIIDGKFCQEVYGKGFNTNLQVCAGIVLGGKDACRGDSGGGLYCNNTLFGIVSYGFGCARPFFPGVYTNVTTFSKWIKTCLEFNGNSETIPSPPFISTESVGNLKNANAIFKIDYFVTVCILNAMFNCLNKRVG